MTRQASWSFRWDYTLGSVISTDSTSLQAQSGGRLVGPWRKQFIPLFCIKLKGWGEIG